MAKRYFGEVIKAVAHSIELENKKDRPSLKQLVERLMVAENCLKNAVDRWDYNSIQESIEEIKFKINKEKTAKNDYFVPKCNLSAEEVLNALNHYDSDHEAADKEYKKLLSELENSKATFLQEAKKKIERLQEIETYSAAAFRIIDHIPSELHHTVKDPVKKRAKYGVHSYVDDFERWVKKGGAV